MCIPKDLLALQTPAAFGIYHRPTTFADILASAYLRYVVVFSVPAAFNKIIMDTTYRLADPPQTRPALHRVVAACAVPAAKLTAFTARRGA